MKRLMVPLLVVGCLALTASAFAATYGTANVTETNVSPKLNISGTFGILGNLGGQQAEVGVYNLLIQGAPANLGIQQPTGFCIEMQYSGSGAHAYNIVDLWEAPNPNGPGSPAGPMGVTTAQQISNLFAAHFNVATSSNVNAAAFQASIWKIIYGNAVVLNDPGSGDIHTALTTSASWVAEAQSYSGPAFDRKLYALTNASYQDYVVVGGPSVPEPMTFILGLMGFGSVAGLRRLRKS